MYHSFMVRIWQDGGKRQFTVEVVQSGETVRFEDLNALLCFIREEVDGGEPADIGQEE